MHHFNIIMIFPTDANWIGFTSQVLSSKLMPTQNRDGGANARMFKENFLLAGGLRYFD